MLKDLYYGKITPWERRNRNASEQSKLVHRIDEEESYFESKMSNDDQKRFQALSKLYSDLAIENECEIFTHGFSLGVRIMMDVMMADSFQSTE